ncbi:MAG: sulfatase [Verrucomicrobiaceae bacterium]|nr:sulfatase [Verrucomicrobiaceae bacterium]
MIRHRFLARTLPAIAWGVCVFAGSPVIAAVKKKKPAAPVTAPKAEVVEDRPVVAAPEGAPNVLFIIADDLNDWVGWLGGHPQARTPNMDRLAKMGMRFTNAHCNYALCNPSRTSLLTGMLPSSSGVFGNEQDWRRSVQVQGKATLPEHFRANGFVTAAGGKIFHANHGGPDGRLAGWHGGRRGFESDAAWSQRFPVAGVQISDLPVHTGRNFNGLDIWHWDWGGINVPEDETDDGKVTSWAAQFLNQPQDKPFLLAIGLYRPHSPWYVPEKFFDERPLDRVVLPEVKADDLDDVPESARGHLKGGENYHAKIVAKDLWKDAVRAYLANITFCDAMLGRVLDALLAGPHAKNTVIVFTSDHGWYLGQKQMWHKGRLWEEATHVPLTILAPGVTRPDSVSSQPVSLIDLYPTLCDLALLPKPSHLDGESLLPLLNDPALARSRPAITTMGGGTKAGHAARDEHWRYIRYADGGEELYDHRSDPHEWTNLAGRPEHQAVIQKLASFFPKEFKSASRTIAEVAPGRSPDGGEDFMLQGGDELSVSDSPRISGKGVYIDATVDFVSAVDADSTLLAHGDSKAGYVLHFVSGQPTLSLFLEGKAAIASLGPARSGRLNVRGIIGTDGTISLSATGGGEIAIAAPFSGGFPVQPAEGLRVGQSFGILSSKNYPNSTPFDGAIRRMLLTVFPPQKDSPPVLPLNPRPKKATSNRIKN